MAYTAAIKKLSENLKTTYENTIFSHSGNIGETREKEVIKYLTRVMAQKYGFQSGEVFDENDVNSGQVDVIMYDNLFSTIFTDGTDKIFAPVESTYGIISVKSKMGISELDNAISGIEKYNNLKRKTIPPNTIQITPDFGMTLGSGIVLSSSKSIYQKNINCIFAFDTTVAVDTILKKVKSAKCIDLLVVPGKVCVIGEKRNEFSLQNADGNVEYAAFKSENAISIFTLFLQIYLSRNRLVIRDVENLILTLVAKSEVLIAKEVSK